MLIYTDAGQNQWFSYFIFTNADGRVLGHKLYVRKENLDISRIEEEAILAAIHWSVMRGGTNTVLTDYKAAIDLYYRKLRPAEKGVYTFQKTIKKLMPKANVTLTWIPRQLNVAGKILERVPTSKFYRDAERMKAFLKGVRLERESLHNHKESNED